MPFDLKINLPAILDRPEIPRDAVHQAMGAGVAALLKDHFLARNSRGNSKGFPRSNYWARARDSVAVGEVDDAHAMVHIRHPGVALHLHGGVVRPVRAKALAVPLRPEVYGVNPREGTVANLFVLASKKSGKAFLAGRGRDGKTRLYWILLHHARVPADPDTLPSKSSLEAAAAKGARSALRAWVAGTR